MAYFSCCSSPCWEVNYKAIPPDTERMFSEQINATTISIPASHTSYVSHPNEIAQLILDAAKGSKR